MSLIGELRACGYPGYTAVFNTDAAVKDRTQQLYISKYGEGPFVPKKVQAAAEEAHRAKLSGTSLIQDKNATPSEPMASVTAVENTLRPIEVGGAARHQGRIERIC